MTDNFAEMTRPIGTHVLDDTIDMDKVVDATVVSYIDHKHATHDDGANDDTVRINAAQHAVTYRRGTVYRGQTVSESDDGGAAHHVMHGRRAMTQAECDRYVRNTYRLAVSVIYAVAAMWVVIAALIVMYRL